MTAYHTVFGSIDTFEKGHIEIINDKPMHYAFSNMFEVAKISKPYEMVIVAKNQHNVIEAVRAEGESPWFTASHDEFAIAMDGEIEIHFHKAVDDEIVPEDIEGTQINSAAPKGPKMGHVVLRRGHQALLPKGSVYQYRARQLGVILLQTIQGANSVEKWAEICYV
jgi:hypothetical protein